MDTRYVQYSSRRRAEWILYCRWGGKGTMRGDSGIATAASHGQKKVHTIHAAGVGDDWDV